MHFKLIFTKKGHDKIEVHGRKKQLNKNRYKTKTDLPKDHRII